MDESACRWPGLCDGYWNRLRYIPKFLEIGAVPPQTKKEHCSVALLPSWLPNETIHSLACRYHLLAAYQDPTVTALQLFRHVGAGNNPLFMTGIDHLSAISQGMLGTCKSMVLDHSSVPFFISFLKPARREPFLSGFGRPGWKYWQTMLRGFYWPTWITAKLRYCPLCLKHDNANFGIGYWHTEHMLPVAQICLLHDCLLVAPPLLHRWSLPTEGASSSSRLDINIPAASARSLLKKAAQICNVIAAIVPDCSNASAICDVFSSALGGLHVTGGPLNLQFHEHVARLFLAYYAPILDMRASVELSLSSEDLQVAIHRVFSAGPSYSPHIFCLLVAWLFESWESFYYQYKQCEQDHAARRRRGCPLHSLFSDEPHGTLEEQSGSGQIAFDRSRDSDNRIGNRR
ncbi:TniQ family protein [Paraburkholderia sediminicola]|uniref:TniQ family protein n=1 Tax=Paraburkholderia sediminicola TaxID=458836 RepID=UPI0038B8705F